ncbi:hypothetical protein EVG20_g693 [Dentipellis fragilis]|uniref:C3H1-type domain-containing protein n=1 Tax=Dentipellis fragilis TaxID=205917 RepID=A0A4Y9ZET8_9AGAM|nr:hypothetical protein EVG20_g693 [Dentipellis fragilis]
MLSSMLAPPPPRSESGSVSDSGSFSGFEPSLAPPRFPHTRAQLSSIARQYKPDTYDSDFEGDDFTRINPGFVARIVSLLDQEREEELKSLLKDKYGDIDDESLEQHVLDLMHKHRDDVAGVPFLFLTPTRRPISRPSSRASSHSARLIPNRPDTPVSAPSSPLAYVFRRPHTPVTSPLGVGQIQTSSSYMNPSGDSPAASPTTYNIPHAYAQYATSLPSSPLSSPRLLNAKAHEFKPHPRPLSAASSNPSTLTGLRAETPSPDLWSHNSRATSNLAIAAPLIPDTSLLSRSNTPSSSLRASISPGEDDDDDPFDPFSAKAIPHTFHTISPADFEPSWINSPASNSSLSDSFHPSSASEHLSSHFSSQSKQDSNAGALDSDANDLLTDGMTPFDVLSSVFGTTLAPSELEEALAANGYDFERSMAWLVDRTAPPQYHGPGQHAKLQNVGGRVSLVSRDGPAAAGFVRGGRAGHQPATLAAGGRNSRFVSGARCREEIVYAGTFWQGNACGRIVVSERALCRFWLRGTCAKQENCEFLHHLPKDVDVSGLSMAMSRTDLNNDLVRRGSPPPDEFPALDYATSGDGKARPGGFYGRNDRTYHDPGRTRFAAAVKKTPPPTTFQPRDHATLAARREAMGSAADSLHHRTAIVAPKPSPRLKLRPPTLLPTLPTGESVNALYMAYRSRALQLGAARNACLSRAADAWRRGDGAAAKRFSREGHDLNTKMAAEMVTAASRLVRERARLTEQAVKARDPSWSDDPGDRTSKGQSCGGGLGVVLGIARMDLAGEKGKLTPEERTECILDLHGLHANEASEVLEEFLLALEREHFYGLVYLVVGEEKHTGTQDAGRGTSRERLAAGVREWLHHWGYPWSERDGVICVDVLTHM